MFLCNTAHEILNLRRQTGRSQVKWLAESLYTWLRRLQQDHNASRPCNHNALRTSIHNKQVLHEFFRARNKPFIWNFKNSFWKAKDLNILGVTVQQPLSLIWLRFILAHIGTWLFFVHLFVCVSFALFLFHCWWYFVFGILNDWLVYDIYCPEFVLVLFMYFLIFKTEERSSWVDAWIRGFGRQREKDSQTHG